VLPHNFHDWYVVRYEHRCSERLFILDVDPPEGGSGSPMRLTFQGVAAIDIDSPWAGNIVLDVTRHEWGPALEGQQDRIVEVLDPQVVPLKYGQPESFADLLEILRRTQLKYFEICTSYGLAGWIIAEQASASARPVALETTL
jgi:hypothetical protein